MSPRSISDVLKGSCSSCSPAGVAALCVLPVYVRCLVQRCSARQLTVLGKQLKKNNVAVAHRGVCPVSSAYVASDVISFGEIEANAAKLKAFHEAVDSSGTSRLLELEPQPGQLLSDLVVQSRLLHDPEAAGGDAGLRVLPGAGGTAGMDFGVDPNADPELYMALQLSLQEDQQRTRQQQEADAHANTGSDNSTSGSGGSTTRPPAPLSALPAGDASLAGIAGVAATDIPTAEQIEVMEGIDDELRQALLLSLQDFSGGQPGDEEGATCNDRASAGLNAPEEGAAADQTAGAADAVASRDVENAGEAPDVSMMTADVEGPAESRTHIANGSAVAAVDAETIRAREGDPLARVLDSLPGVNVNDPRMQEALRAAAIAEEEKEGEDTQELPSNIFPKSGETSDKDSKEQE